MAKVTPQIVQHLTANMNLSRKEIMFNNFLGGLAWGFGTAVGATVVVAVIGYILKSLGIFNTLGALFGGFGGSSI